MSEKQELLIETRLKDFATKELKRASGEFEGFRKQAEGAAVVAQQKLNLVGSAASQVGNLVGGAAGELISLGGHSLTAVHSLAAAFAGPAGVVAGVGAAYAAVLLLKPKLEELGEAFKKALPGANQGLLTLIAPGSAKEIRAAFEEMKKFDEEQAAAAKLAGDAPARLEKFNAALAQSRDAFDLARQEAQLFGIAAGPTLQKQIASTGAAVITLVKNLDRSKPEQIDAYLALFEQLKRLQEKYKEVTAEAERFKEQEKEEAEALRESERACVEYAAGLAKAREEDIKLVEAARERHAEMLKQIDTMQGLKAGFQDLAAEAQLYGAAARQAVHGVSNAIAGDATDAILEYAEGAKSAKAAFKDFARSVLKDIARIIIQTIILKAVQGTLGGIGNAIGSIGSSVNQIDTGGGLQPAAKGAVYNEGRLLKFASGGVLNGPATFPLRGGGRGLAGEAGPEGILPLARDSQGRLGVHSQGSGGGNIINLSIVVQQPAAGTSFKESRDFAKMVAQAVASELQTNAAFRGQIRNA